MKISIAGAGAGKTTKIADLIIDCYKKCSPNKIVYCVAYTNNATKCIKNKICQRFGCIPSRIKISTIHSFLYQDLIKPYYYLLFGIHFNDISYSNITDAKYKNAEFKHLEEKGSLHIDAMSERAKWVFVKKSNDTKDIKNRRKIIQNVFKSYCDGFFLDEAQDINNDIYEIIVQFYNLGLNVHIVGDPKQDLRGYDNLQKLINEYPESVSYFKECYRCPSSHLELSNTLVEGIEKQIAISNITGILKIVYENDISIEPFILKNDFGLVYISEKNERFDTHVRNNSIIDEKLFEELKNIIAIKHPDADKMKISRLAYYLSERFLDAIRKEKNIDDVIKKFEEWLKRKIDNQEYAKLKSILNSLFDDEKETKIVFSSIESIKGMEHKKCLFVLTPDLAPYLFLKKKENNKTKHKLYVALTRSTDSLFIMITRETELKYGRDFINSFMSSYASQKIKRKKSWTDDAISLK